MARTARVVVENFPHHIVQRGNRNQQVFFGEADKAEYLRLLGRFIRQHHVEIWAYCVMDTHVHLVAVPRQPTGLARALAETHKRYSRMINFRYGWRGYLWQGRFASYLMDERYLYAAVRYVERNPVAAGMVQRAEDYPWSSAKAHVLKRHDPPLSPSFLEEQIPDWSAYLRVDGSTPIERHLSTGRPWGGRAFIRTLERRVGRVLGRKKPGPKAKSKRIKDVSPELISGTRS